MSNAYVLTMTEDDLAAFVIELAQFRGWKVVHFRPARTEHGYRTAVQGDVGSPDLILARRGVVLLVELKAERGRLTPQQKEWAKAIGPYIYRLWKPSDLESIKEVLA